MVTKPALDTRLTMMILGFPLCFLIPHTREPTEWRGRARGQQYPPPKSSTEDCREAQGLLSVCQACLGLFYMFGSLL